MTEQLLGWSQVIASLSKEQYLPRLWLRTMQAIQVNAELMDSTALKNPCLECVMLLAA
eukprot:jgi/Mesen1/1745/ME001390S00738